VRRTFKWIAGMLAGVVLVAGVAVVLGLQLGQRKMMRVVDVALTPLAYVTDTPSVAGDIFSSRAAA
jgi:uncharacterized membrane protein YgaE (UPF0421/DUF939 family)